MAMQYQRFVFLFITFQQRIYGNSSASFSRLSFFFLIQVYLFMKLYI